MCVCVSLSPTIGIPVTINKFSFKPYVLRIITAIAPPCNFETKQNMCFGITHLNRAVFYIFTKLLGQFWLVAVSVILFATFQFQFFKDGLLIKMQTSEISRSFHPHFYRNDSAVNISA
jgi:hypothetical protein